VLEDRNNSKPVDLTRITEEAPINNIKSLQSKKQEATSSEPTIHQERKTNNLFDIHSQHPLHFDENKNILDKAGQMYEKWKRE